MTYCFMTVPFGDFDNAIEHLDEAAKIGSDLNLEEPRLFGLTHTANTLTYMTRFEEASKVTREALQLDEDLGNHKWRSELLGFPSVLYHLRNGDLDSARESAQLATDLAGRIGAAYQEGLAELSLGQVAWLRGEYQAAVGHYQQALQAGRVSGLPFVQVSALCGLGTAHLDISSSLLDQTTQFHAEALELMELPLGITTGALAWADLGFCLLAVGDAQQAGELFEKGLTVPTAFRYLARPLLLVGSAFVALGGGDVSEAGRLAQEAREFGEERSMKHFYPLLALAGAQVSIASGEPQRGLESLNRAETLALEMGMKPWAWQAQTGAAGVLTSLGQDAAAAEKRSAALGTVNEIAALFEDQALQSMYLEDTLKKIG